VGSLGLGCFFGLACCFDFPRWVGFARGFGFGLGFEPEEKKLNFMLRGFLVLMAEAEIVDRRKRVITSIQQAGWSFFVVCSEPASGIIV